MAAVTNNLNDFLRKMARMEKAVELEVIRESRKRMRAIMRSLKPLAKKISPKDTGDLQKSIKVKSRSRRGLSTAKLVWMVNYAGPLNFKKGQSVEKFATDLWESEKARIDNDGSRVVKDVMKEVLESHGVKVVNE